MAEIAGPLTIYHNPRCSKSRATLALLVARGFSPRIVDYLAAPPAAGELAAIVDAMQSTARGIVREKDARETAPELLDPATPPRAILEALAANPALIERPIVVYRGRAVIGRPPEAVLAILCGAKKRRDRSRRFPV